MQTQKRNVKVYDFQSINDAPPTELYLQRLPFVLKGIDIGPCTNLWTADYLTDKLKSKEVRVHVSNTPQMDFLRKNFTYKSMMFEELIHESFSNRNLEISDDVEKKYYYLRALGGNPRKDIADIHKDFPSISDDIKFGHLLPSEQFFSSIFRISSIDVQLWTHYDIMDNILIQVRGKKKVVLFSPCDLPYLYLVGDKSAVLDIDNPDINEFPKFLEATKYECVLNSGDILFIPALWFHNVTSLDPGIAVNVFWHHLNAALYDKKDTYGNKDLLPATQAMQMVDKAIKMLSVLPEEYKHFYLQRLINQLQCEIG